MFEGFDFASFWNNCQYAQKNYVGDALNEAMIRQAEEELGYKLPESYLFLLKQQNGGIPNKCVFSLPEPRDYDDEVVITGLFGIDRKKPYSLCGEFGNELWLEEWQYPAIGVAICETITGGHDMVFLDYRECGNRGEPKVSWVIMLDGEEEEYEIVPLAENFEAFVRGLTDEED